MRLATFFADFADNVARVGAVDGGGARVFDLAAAATRASADASAFASMLSLIDADDAGLDLARTLLEKRGGEADLWRPLAEVVLLAPLPEPRQMRDGMSFATHILQSARGARALQALKADGVEAFEAAMAAPLGDLPAVYRRIPIYYITNRQTVVGPGATVRWPRYSKVMDYELEIAAITKRTRANIPAAEASRHIFGYTIFNDFSARDRQTIEMEGRLGPAKGKSFDGSNAMGPWIVTADELGDPQTLKVDVKVNGETRSTGDTGAMLFSFAEFIADAAQDETIRAGEVFGSGTVGNCCGLEIGRFLQSGDEIVLGVDRIGVLQNTVIAQA
ncbi:2-keto-4-pentenoate hydratase/2-oxohepta-3-ene-1,7-dioic acid hydratase in catechol pathway [Roseiarcus fermentans]|uniref:2-keto-4-pentenoate hydratase/2-oxohepta-3-ene-1,7-dioic acid hydratase in catechol pathway n=1 Tax=Roseiarcus fermentans TaxID=1473586 RepID=A0A366FLK2_9HYPH|nr:fumarylacetoacetate hydrolase family protein [Roseiarcus fermentans]RBP15518.1 2-keto-4-pentenoate hydratase/2-oxohepta-3-ene-1,7-dioic acid hydratase in catechol pathway [Roseiarcus fermentans]